MKLKKLDARGFSHDMLIVLFVVIFAISGVAYLVASHADSCDSTVSGATSGAASSAVSVSGAVSADCPASGATSAAVSVDPAVSFCAITNVPSNPTYQQVLQPAVKVTIGTAAKTVSAYTYNLVLFNAQGATVSTTNVKAGIGSSQNLAAYTAPYSSATVTSGKYVVASNSPPYTCSASFTLPKAPVVAPTPTPTPTPKTTPAPVTAPKPLANILVEGETMAYSKDPYNLSDSSASNKQYRAMYHAGTISNTFQSTGNLTGVTVHARGSQCLGAPSMVLTVDGKVISTTDVAATVWTNYTASISSSNASKNHSVVVSFPNDKATTSCDRNLYIDVLTFTQKA